jgi:hypothetical protein
MIVTPVSRSPRAIAPLTGAARRRQHPGWQDPAVSRDDDRIRLLQQRLDLRARLRAPDLFGLEDRYGVRFGVDLHRWRPEILMPPDGPVRLSEDGAHVLVCSKQFAEHGHREFGSAHEDQIHRRLV